MILTFSPYATMLYIALGTLPEEDILSSAILLTVVVSMCGIDLVVLHAI